MRERYRYLNNLSTTNLNPRAVNDLVKFTRGSGTKINMPNEVKQEIKSIYELFILNLEIASALWVHVAAFEITLRNFIHNALSTIYQRIDWWNIPNLLTGVDNIDINRRLLRLKEREITPDPILFIENLTLAFWVHLLSKKYHQKIWIKVLPFFSVHPGRRESFFKKCRSVKDLRNSIAHHGPILRRNLLRDYEYLTELTRYLNPELALEVERNSRVLELLQIAKSW